MPAWMTSLLRDEVSKPMPYSRSSTITSMPARASARATASPTTPAPMTTHSTYSAMLPPHRILRDAARQLKRSDGSDVEGVAVARRGEIEGEAAIAGDDRADEDL